MDPGEILELYHAWGYWLWIGLITAAQAALLLVPLKAAEKRWKSRRPVLVPAIVTTLLLALLSFAGLGSLVGAIFADDGLDRVFRFLAFTISGPEATPLSAGRPANQASQDLQVLLGVLNLTLVFWVLWGLVFWKFARTKPAGSVIHRCLQWLLRGSILELLIAVPSHVIVRRRGDCCAPGMTMAGLVTGLAVMLMCFGRGVFWLFVKRARRLKPGPPLDRAAT
jgi:hypothetical protein